MKRYYNVDLSARESTKTALAMMPNANVSLKYATEIGNHIKGKSLGWVEKFLQDIVEKKRYLPLKQYHKKVAHRKGDALMGQKAGRYPQKTVTVYQKLVANAKANADYKGLDLEKLVVKHAFASQGFGRMGLQSKGQIGGKMRKRKSAHLEIVLMEAR